MPTQNSTLMLALTAGALVLTACSTVPNNPNYQYSSKYGQAGTDTMQVAEAWPSQTQPVQAQEMTPVQQSQPTLASSQTPAPSTSPTEQAYNADQMVGTPGYEMMRAQSQQAQPQQVTVPAPQVLQPQPVPSQATGPREVTYDYAQNMIGNTPPSAPTPLDTQPVPGTAVNTQTGYSYQVQPGDTVYNISRRLCVPITDITTPNGIGTDYAIAIGQTLTLPNTRC